MADKWSKFKSIFSTGKIAVAVGKTIVTGKAGKTFDKVEKGAEIADKVFDIIELLKHKK